MLNFNLKRQGAAPSLAAAMVMSGCAMMAPKADRYVAPPLGSTWESMRRDAGSYGTGSVKVFGRRGERTYQGEQVLTFESPTA
jgi:hypothetical protein